MNSQYFNEVQYQFDNIGNNQNLINNYQVYEIKGSKIEGYSLPI